MALGRSPANCSTTPRLVYSSALGDTYSEECAEIHEHIISTDLLQYVRSLLLVQFHDCAQLSDLITLNDINYIYKLLHVRSNSSGINIPTTITVQFIMLSLSLSMQCYLYGCTDIE